MRFLVDAQLPPALARWRVTMGHEAEHVAGRNLETAPDGEIWIYAQRTAAVIITRDEDFAQRKVLVADGPRVVWVRLPNPRRREILAAFEKLLPVLLSAFDRGETIIEVT